MTGTRVGPTILGVGMFKTGTTSLHRALQQLGFVSCHHRHRGVRGRQLIDRALAAGAPPLSLMPGYDAWSDMALYRDLEDLDAHHPGARYVLTLRDVDAWVRSALAHNERERTAGDERQVTERRLRDEYHRVEEHVRSHFAGRPDDLLVMDVAAGDGWEPLCRFLGVPVPPVPFPHANPRPANGRRRLWRR